MKEDLITIIIPVYNVEKYIQETIDTIKEQTYQNWEILFIDDCSTDRSIEIIKRNLNSKMHLILLKKHSGTAVARNEGIKLARGRYISFLDADDYWEKNKLEKQLQYMKDNNYPFTYISYRYVRGKKCKKGRKIKIQKNLSYYEALKNIRISTSSVMIDVKQISKDNLYMIDVNNEDVATWWKLLKNGYTAYGMDEPLVYWRIHRNSKTSNKFKNARNRWDLYRKVEKFSIWKSMYYMCYYIFYGFIKRI